MLDEKDLQAIATLIDARLDAKFDEKLKPIHEEISKNSDEIRKINVTLENDVFPQLRLLAEGQKTILETMAPKNRVEALEDEVIFLKQVIKSISRDVSELKKAQ